MSQPEGFLKTNRNFDGEHYNVLVASMSRRKLWEVFLELLDTFEVVYVVLESSHYYKTNYHEDFLCEIIDVPVLKSVLIDYEELLLNDGCTGIAIIDETKNIEIQLTQHKLIFAYNGNFEHIVSKYATRNDSLEIIKMRHISNENYLRQFHELRKRLGEDPCGLV